MQYIKELKDKYTIDEIKHTIFRGDNREVLKTFPNECVDLVYIDPPFFSGRKYTATAHDGEIVTYIDMYRDSDTYLQTMYESLVELHRVLKNTGSIYLHCDWRASHKLRLLLDKVFDEDNFLNEIIWSYKTGGTSSKWFSKKHDTIFFYSKSKDYIFNPTKEKSYTKSKSRKPGIINYGKGEAEFFEDDIGVYNWVNSKDVWEIPYINSQAKERINGFKTQKPIELLEKIIKTSSNPGDIVLDAFMGTGTTLETAYLLRRVPIGVDIGLIQTNTTLRRCMSKHYRGTENTKVIGMSKQDIDDYKLLIKSVEETKQLDDKRFEQLVVSILGGKWTGGVGDGNVDGRMPNGDIIQVKQSEGIGPGEIQKLSGTLDSENHNHAILVAYSFTNGVKPKIKEIMKNAKHKSIEIIRVDQLVNKAKAIDNIIEEIEKQRKEIEQEVESEKKQTRLDW